MSIHDSFDAAGLHPIDGLSDITWPQTDRVHTAGTHVIVHCGDFDAVLVHLRRGNVAAQRLAHPPASRTYTPKLPQV